MELQEFIETSITDIFNAVENLQRNDKDVKKLKGIVSPSVIHNAGSSTRVDKQTRFVTTLHFSLALDTEKETDGGGKLRIKVLSAGIGHKRTDSTVSNLSFDINVALPSVQTEEKYVYMPDIQVLDV